MNIKGKPIKCSEENKREYLQDFKIMQDFLNGIQILALIFKKLISLTNIKI